MTGLEQVKKVWQQGNSLVITIEQEICKVLKIRNGDYIRIRIKQRIPSNEYKGKQKIKIRRKIK